MRLRIYSLSVLILSSAVLGYFFWNYKYVYDELVTAYAIQSPGVELAHKDFIYTLSVFLVAFVAFLSSLLFGGYQRWITSIGSSLTVLLLLVFLFVEIIPNSNVATIFGVMPPESNALVENPPPSIFAIVKPAARTTHLSVVVSLGANGNEASFGPIILRVDSVPGNGYSIHNAYFVTHKTIRLSGNKSYRHTFLLPLPPSGSYDVVAKSSGAKSFMPLTFFVNRGHYYRSGVITVNKTIVANTLYAGKIKITLTRIEMSPYLTKIFFTIPTNANAGFMNNNHTYVQEIVGKENLVVNTVPLGSTMGPFTIHPRIMEWDIEPIRSDTKELKITIPLVASNSVFRSPFLFVVPLK